MRGTLEAMRGGRWVAPPMQPLRTPADPCIADPRGHSPLPPCRPSRLLALDREGELRRAGGGLPQGAPSRAALQAQALAWEVHSVGHLALDIFQRAIDEEREAGTGRAAAALLQAVCGRPPSPPPTIEEAETFGWGCAETPPPSQQEVQEALRVAGEASRWDQGGAVPAAALSAQSACRPQEACGGGPRGRGRAGKRQGGGEAGRRAPRGWGSLRRGCLSRAPMATCDSRLHPACRPGLTRATRTARPPLPNWTR